MIAKIRLFPYLTAFTLMFMASVWAQDTTTQPAAAIALPSQPVSIDLQQQPHLGHPGAPVLILLFKDFSCPHCKRFTEEVMSTLIKEFVLPGYAYVVFINYPIVDKNSFFAAWAGECAFKQNNLGFWRYYRYIFQYQRATETWASPEFLADIARRHVTELNADELLRCIVEGDFETEVLNDLAYGQSLGIPGVPMMLINNNPVPGTDYSYMSDMIYLALEEVFNHEKTP